MRPGTFRPMAAAGSAPAAALPAVGGGNGVHPGDWNSAPWLFPPSDFRDLDKYGSAALPAAAGGTALIVWTFNNQNFFNVPPGRSGMLTALGVQVTANGGAAFVPDVIPYELTFSLLLNGKPFPGDFGMFNFAPGSVMWPSPISGLKLRENQKIQFQVTNNTLVQTTQFVGVRLQGYFYGKNFDPQILGSQ